LPIDNDRWDAVDSIASTTFDAFGEDDMSATRDAVRDRYREAARRMSESPGCCGGDCCGQATDETACGAAYAPEDLAEVGLGTSVSLGCGNPLLLADLRPGQVVLDLGSGGGLDVQIGRASCRGRVLACDVVSSVIARTLALM